MSAKKKCGESKSLKFSQHRHYLKRTGSPYNYKCQCGKDFRKERKLTKHQIKHGHGNYKNQIKHGHRNHKNQIKYGQGNHNKSHETSLQIKEQKKKDLLGSILTGMANNANKEKEWEGEVTPQDTTPAYAKTTTTANSVVSKKDDSVANDMIIDSSFSLGFGASKERVSRKIPCLMHLQAKEKIKLRVKERTSFDGNSKIKHALFKQERSIKNQDKTANGRNSSSGKSNHSRVDKYEDQKDSHVEFARYMNGVKSSGSKSAWKGSQRIGSLRTDWRPERAYDFHRNDMDVNDSKHPNDDFDLCRISSGGRRSTN